MPIDQESAPDKSLAPIEERPSQEDVDSASSKSDHSLEVSDFVSSKLEYDEEEDDESVSGRVNSQLVHSPHASERRRHNVGDTTGINAIVKKGLPTKLFSSRTLPARQVLHDSQDSMLEEPPKNDEIKKV